MKDYRVVTWEGAKTCHIASGNVNICGSYHDTLTELEVISDNVETITPDIPLCKKCIRVYRAWYGPDSLPAFPPIKTYKKREKKKEVGCFAIPLIVLVAAVIIGIIGDLS